MKTEINYETLKEAGFEPCIFAPIYLSQYSYYLGNLDWSKGEVTEIIKPKWWEFFKKPEIKKYTLCNNLNWNDATMIVAISADGKSYIDWWSRERFFTIEEIKEYCKNKGIEMWASKK
jgi:hypothetical protein